MIGYRFDLSAVIGESYDRRRKQFVEVIAEHKPDGTVVPQTVILSGTQRFDVELYRDPVVTEVSLSGCRLVVYPIRANGVKTYLFEDSGRWYVMMKS